MSEPPRIEADWFLPCGRSVQWPSTRTHSRALPIDPDTATSVGTPLHLRVWAVALAGVGGVFGAPLRYQLGVWFPHSAGGWPVTTFAINTAGAFALG